MQFCGEPGCGVLVPHGRCPTHALGRPRTARYPWEAWYDTAAWARLRMHVLREQPFCRVCRQQHRNTVATDVDHIVRHNGDRVKFWDVDNLQGLCKACHTRKTTSGQ